MRVEWKRTLRTVVQIAVAVCASAPLILPALGLSATAGVGASVIAVSAAVTRVMSIPAVAELLNKYLKIPMPE